MAANAAIDDRVPAVMAHLEMHLQLAAPDFGFAMPSCGACECFHILRVYQEAEPYVGFCEVVCPGLQHPRTPWKLLVR